MGAEQQIASLLGLAQRARRMVSGAFPVEEAVKKGKACFLLIAEDAEPHTKKKYQELAEKSQIPFAFALSREALGACLGKEYRAVCALLDAGFAKKLRQLCGGAGMTD